MDSLASLKFLSVPAWARLVIAAQLLFALGLSLYLLYESVTDQTRYNTLEAAAYILGVVFPVLIIALIVWSAETGPKALQGRTTTFLTQFVPEFLKRIVEDDPKFRAVPSRLQPKRSVPASAFVKCNAVQDRCYCDYLIEYKCPTAPKPTTRQMLLRLELNVKKANFNLYLEKAYLAGKLGVPDVQLENVSNVVRNKFRHTLHGAQSGLTPSAGTPGDGYQFNELLLERVLHGQTYLVLVGFRHLPADFLWNPAERLFFAQDLMFMVRAFATEQPELFPAVA